LYIFHTLDEYINTLSSKSPVSSEYLAKTSENISKKEKIILKKEFWALIGTKVFLRGGNKKNDPLKNSRSYRTIEVGN
jgi:hypothetical protein